MRTCALPRVPLTWSFILCRGSHSAVTQLRVIPSYEPSFLRSASGSWVDVLGANSCAPITGYLPWGISTFLSYHARGSPWLWPSHRSYLFQGLPAVAWVLHELGYPLPVLDLRPWSRLSLLLTTVLDCRGPKPLRRRLSPSGDASPWATPHFGRHLTWATPPIGDDSSGRPADFSSLGPSRGPHYALTLTFGQRPITGQYTNYMLINVIYKTTNVVFCCF